DPYDDVGNKNGDNNCDTSANPKSASGEHDFNESVKADKDMVDSISADTSTSEGSGNNASNIDATATLGNLNEADTMTNVESIDLNDTESEFEGEDFQNFGNLNEADTMTNVESIDLNDTESEFEGEDFQNFGNVFGSPKIDAQTN
nr:hypothetical protein [Tanacetum cinerariifolium]